MGVDLQILEVDEFEFDVSFSIPPFKFYRKLRSNEELSARSGYKSIFLKSISDRNQQNVTHKFL